MYSELQSMRTVRAKMRPGGKLLSLRWQSVIWTVNGVFLLLTVIVGSLTSGSVLDRQGINVYLFQFSLAEEKNMATSWEGWCLLLIAILAFERLLHCRQASAKVAWSGLAILAVALSFDELASIHERSYFLFSSWGVADDMTSMIPLGVPAFAVLLITLYTMWHLPHRRCFWLTLSAFLVLGSVAFQEHLEHAVAWPSWARGLRFGLEEGTELCGIYLLLRAATYGMSGTADASSIARLVPRITTLIGLRAPVLILSLVAFVPLGILTMWVIEDATHRGVPGAWLPFVLLSLSGMAAWACAEIAEGYKTGFRFLSVLAIFFALDQMVTFERLFDRHLLRGVIGTWMFPCMAAACLSIRPLRTRENMILVGLLLPLSLLFAVRSELLGWLVVPIQSLGIYWILTSTLATAIIPNGHLVQ
jgi:hypothetical protein